jgi:hypothetical protein
VESPWGCAALGGSSAGSGWGNNEWRMFSAKRIHGLADVF